MANGHGGYRRPENPAPVSGPGKLSRRTDGAQPTVDIEGGKYGETQELRELQGGAAMAQAQGPTPVDTSGIVPLDAPTMYPDRPVTDGAASGPGASSLPMPGEIDDIMQYQSWLHVLKFLASQSYASNQTRQTVRQLEGTIFQNQ